MAEKHSAERQETQSREKKPEENPFVAKFESFFRSQCKKQIEALVERYPEKKSLEVDFKELEHYDYELADELLANPAYLIEAAEFALGQMDIPALEIEEFKPHVRFHSLPKDSWVILRDIGSEHLGKMIAVEGIVKQMTDVLPKLKVATWQCRRCGNTYKIEQEGQQVQTPAMCECRHKDFLLVPDESMFVDYQKIQVQEPLELLKGSEQGTNLDIYLNDDLVNMVAPGDRVCITGILNLSYAQSKKSVYNRILDAVHVEETQREFEELEITKEEEEEIKKLAKDPKIYNMLVQSLAPAIYGHEAVKEAIVMQLFGGVKKTLPGNMNVRGNIHILLVGDPSVGKSQLLQTVHNIAPKSIYVGGKTSSGAGLTATAVKTDEFGEGGWVLKAGALVLASGGTTMVDEFEKMDDEDRGAMHEAMEQGMVSVAKAGIVTRFKTETSILAAANPKLSRFDQYTNFLEQIDLPPSLMSRFDLFFMIVDPLDKTKDEKIANHILRSHQAGEEMRRDAGKENRKKHEMEEKITPEIDAEKMRRYISYARQKVFPVMSEESIKSISEFYVGLREAGRSTGSYAATHRQLEALVRLSEASARVRLSGDVEHEDTERAIRLLRESLRQVVTDKETGRIDTDLIAAGQSKSQVDSIRKIVSIVKEKAKEMDDVPIELVLDEAVASGIERERAISLISRLKKSGEFYEPKNGFLKPADRE